MIDPSLYPLNSQEQQQIAELLGHLGPNPSLESKRKLMDEIWDNLGCSNKKYNQYLYQKYYSHPIWLLQGLFIEQHDVSMGHREAIAKAVSLLHPQNVVDYGGGFGTLARIIARYLPNSNIFICEPHPPRVGKILSESYNGIRFIPELYPDSYDVLVSTDVLEHAPDPITLLATMICSVRIGGHLFIANCFYPVIKCHLPCTFHLRYSFDAFCAAMGLERVGTCHGSHATIYRKTCSISFDWKHLRQMEQKSKLDFYFKEFSRSSSGRLRRAVHSLSRRCRQVFAHRV